MITARAFDNCGSEVILLGLSRGNIDRLTAGQPIFLSRETHGEAIPADWKICILFGETEGRIADLLEKAGFIGPETKISVDPRHEQPKKGQS